MKRGRPINPKSERQCEPWEALGISRASYYWMKRYGALPPDIFSMGWPDPLRNELRKLVRRHPHYNLWVTTKGWSSGGILREQIEWLIRKMGLTGEANRIARRRMKRTSPPEYPFADEPDIGVDAPPDPLREELRAACIVYDYFNEQEKAHYDTTAAQVLARVTFTASPCAAERWV